MKPEPLQNKIIHWIKDESFDNKPPIIRIDDDIKSAVEWLKEQIKTDKYEKLWTSGLLDDINIFELIDKAFEDVIK